MMFKKYPKFHGVLILYRQFTNFLITPRIRYRVSNEIVFSICVEAIFAKAKDDNHLGLQRDFKRFSKHGTLLRRLAALSDRVQREHNESGVLDGWVS